MSGGDEGVTIYPARVFPTGATRSPAEGKPEYAGYLHPSVIKAYGEYMLKHQTQSDGKQRDSRNYRKGIPLESYMQSMFRHFVEVWSIYEANMDTGINQFDRADMIEALTALFFNVHGMTMEILKEK